MDSKETTLHPRSVSADSPHSTNKPPARMHRLRAALGTSLFLTLCLIYYTSSSTQLSFTASHTHRPPYAATILVQCAQLHAIPGPPPNFHERTRSDRLEPGTRPVLIRNGMLWTGGENGTEVLQGRDILLDDGIIQSIGYLGYLVDGPEALAGLEVVDAQGRWVTPGIIDVHSHMGSSSAPAMEGAMDDNSLKGNTQPWLRIVDAVNTHDMSYELSAAGGVTTALILPGSADAIGGQAIVIKLRPTSERSTLAMVLEPPYSVNTSFPDPNLPLRWRHMKHACGENPSGVYHGTRMDTFWDFRTAYNTAKKIKDAQDQYCVRAFNGDWKNLGDYPQELQWEALVDVLRGRVKVNTHCYEAVDIDAFVRLTNEFKFSLAAFHHASEAYLVPDLIKRAYGKPPAVALFAIYGGYKRESYRSSEFAPRILAEQGLTVLLKSDHPAVNSRYLLHEAQQAYFYGLPANLAIASVTSNSAETLGMGHRIGYIRKGYDADLVIWDSHPLALGATPVQVFIDGIPQLRDPAIVSKPRNFQSIPKVPNFDEEAKKAVQYEGLPDLTPNKTLERPSAIFKGVKSLHVVKEGLVQEMFSAQDDTNYGIVVVQDGSIICHGVSEGCMQTADASASSNVIDLDGGSISPGLVSYGCGLGIEEIFLEPSTTDGPVFDPLEQRVPRIIGGETSLIRAVDGLQFGTRHALEAYRSGVTLGVTAPLGHGGENREGFFQGLGVFFNLGAGNKLEEGAILQDITAVHMAVRHREGGVPSISTQIAALRRLLLYPAEGEIGVWFGEVRSGKIPLVVEAHSADIIATLIILKKEIRAATGKEIRLTISGATEAHLLGKELSEADVGVILVPARPFPHTWEERRIIPGPPLSNSSAVMELVSNNVVVGLGCEGMWSAQARNLPFNIGWAAIESGGRLSKEEAIALGSSNMMKLLGVHVDDESVDLVASRGGDLLDFDSKVVAVISARDRKVQVL
ncbi:carbohydrate esterase family 9 protein [Pholiota conissans]|uniref:Carbohydrate esterase family 9 protein n=1 Tax=Pholiota conissans TaxID=109636 RepID=A0A9P6D2Y4_9AGAR|nr:carbohydrate esterase family 9 protein [Pholiota conissans]